MVNLFFNAQGTQIPMVARMWRPIVLFLSGLCVSGGQANTMPDSRTSEAVRHCPYVNSQEFRQKHVSIVYVTCVHSRTHTHTKNSQPHTHTQSSYELQRGFDVITLAILSSVVDRILAALVGHVGANLLQAKIFSTFTKSDLSRQDVAAACQQGYEAVMCTCVRSS